MHEIVQAFVDLNNGSLKEFVQRSNKISKEVYEQALATQQAYQEQIKILSFACAFAEPNQSEVANILKYLGNIITKIQEIGEKNRASKFYNHLAAVSASIPAFGWIAVKMKPVPYIKEMNDAGQFYTNRVLKEWKDKDPLHVEWVKYWVEFLKELQALVKQHYTTGLTWLGKTIPDCKYEQFAVEGLNQTGPVLIQNAAPGVPPPPPPFLEPPTAVAAAAGDAGLDRSALFADINKGEAVTKNLKKVTADMQTHKNKTLREGPAPFKPPAIGRKPISAVQPVVADKVPVFTREGKKWLIEYQKNQKELVVQDAEMNNVVYLYKCENSTVQVKGKLNSITMDSCKKTSIVFDNLVSSMEFINCQSVQMQVLGKVPTVSIDKSDGCQVYLSKDSLDVEIISSKSSEMNIMIPKGDDYIELPVPEQFKTKVTPEKTLDTQIIENKG